MMVRVIVLLIFSQLLTSCFVSKDGPEGTLKGFIARQFSGNVSKSEILGDTTGALYNEYNNMSDELFDKIYKSNKYKKGKINIHFKKCNENRCSITYSINYTMGIKKGAGTEVEIKKMATLLKNEKDIWKISNIMNIKTYYEPSEIIVK